MGRGIERAFLLKLIDSARNNGHEYAEATFRETGKNKMMRSMYQMTGFKKLEDIESDSSMIFHMKTNNIQKSPNWVEVK